MVKAHHVFPADGVQVLAAQGRQQVVAQIRVVRAPGALVTLDKGQITLGNELGKGGRGALHLALLLGVAAQAELGAQLVNAGAGRLEAERVGAAQAVLTLVGAPVGVAEIPGGGAGFANFEHQALAAEVKNVHFGLLRRATQRGHGALAEHHFGHKKASTSG